MRNEITMEMSICQAENGFSLVELVKKVTDAFENKAFSGILKMNLQLASKAGALGKDIHFQWLNG